MLVELLDLFLGVVSVGVATQARKIKVSSLLLA